MNETVKALVEKVLNSRADKGFWKSKAVEEAVTWARSKAKELGLSWSPAWKSEIEARADEVYAAKGLNDRGQKS
jgi:poly(3-hydroxyalkanoate) synthetase